MSISKLGNFLKTNFIYFVTIFFIIEWLQILPEAEIYWGPAQILIMDPSHLFNGAIYLISNLFGFGNKITIYALWTLTFLTALLVLFNKTRKWAALGLWILIMFWMESKNAALYGIYFYFSVYFLLVFLSDWLKDKTILWHWGKVFLCLTYFNAGFSKLTSAPWRSGEIIWLILSAKLTEFGIHTTASMVAIYPLIIFSSWVIIISQFTAPVILWKTKWARYWIFIDCVAHIAAAFLLNLYLFSAMLIFLNISLLRRDTEKI